MANRNKITRAGAYWLMEDGTRLAWDENSECFINPITGETYELIDRISEDCVVVG